MGLDSERRVSTKPMFDGKLTDVQRKQDIEASHDVHFQIDASRIAGEDRNYVILGAWKKPVLTTWSGKVAPSRD